MRRPFDAAGRLAALVAGGDAGQFEMAIDAAGDWRHEGRPIRRPALVRLLATALRRAADGSYWLVTPHEAGRVRVADVPFTIVELEVTGEGSARVVRLRTNLDAWLTLDADHPLVMRPPPEGGAPVPYVTVRDGLEARLLRAVYYHLVDLAEPAARGSDVYGVWSAGRFVPLGPVSTPP